MQTSKGTYAADERIQLLQKLMALHAWDVQGQSPTRPEGEPPLLSLLLAQAASPAGCGPLEAALQQPEGERPETPPAGVDERVYRRLLVSEPLREQFQQPPLLSQVSQVDPVALRVLGRLARVTPSEGVTMLQSDDTLFMRILDRAREEPVTVEHFLLQDLAKLLDLEATASDVVEELTRLAAGEAWPETMQQVELYLEQGGRVPRVQSGHSTDTLLAAIEAYEPPSGRNPVVDTLLSRPRLSAVPPALVALYGRALGKVGRAQVRADAMLQDLRQARPDEMAVVTQHLQYRLEAANYFLELRKFAKLDALAYRWPDLYRRFNLDRASVLELEVYVNEPEVSRDEPGTLPPAARRLWQRYGEDETLLRYLRLHPLLSEIYEKERASFQAVQAQVARPETPSAIIREKEALESPIQAVTAATGEAAPPDIVLRLTRLEGAGEPAGQARYRLELTLADETHAAEVQIDWDEMAALEGQLLVHAADTEPAEERFRRLGLALYSILFPSQVGDALLNTLQPVLDSSRQQRLLLQLEAPELHLLPWESLYLPRPVDRLVSGSSHFSLLRYVPVSGLEPLRPGRLPLRVLAALQAPADQSGADLVYERSLLQSAIDDHSLFHLKFVENATWERLYQESLEFQPQVVHFVTPTPPDAEAQAGRLVFVDEGGNSTFVVAGEIVPQLREQARVALLVLNPAGTPTRMMVEDPFTIRSAVALVSGGLPAVVGPTRTGVASVSFLRAFYNALAQGETIEAAVLRGRRTLKAEKQAWIRYAFFSGVQEPVRLIG